MLCKDLSARMPAAIVGNDNSSKNLMRPAFVSHDADDRLRHDAQPLQWLDRRKSRPSPHPDRHGSVPAPGTVPAPAGSLPAPATAAPATTAPLLASCSNPGSTPFPALSDPLEPTPNLPLPRFDPPTRINPYLHGFTSGSVDLYLIPLSTPHTPAFEPCYLRELPFFRHRVPPVADFAGQFQRPTPPYLFRA